MERCEYHFVEYQAQKKDAHPAVVAEYKLRCPPDSEWLAEQNAEPPTKKSWGKNRCVYAIRGASLVKIGVAHDPDDRLNSLQTGSPVKLSLMGWVPGPVSLERKIHKLLSDYREHGEWFRYEGEAKEIADAIASGDPEKVQDRVNRTCGNCTYRPTRVVSQPPF